MVLVQPAPNTIRPQPIITVDGVLLKCVDSLKYLGSEIYANGSQDREITSRIQKASQALDRLGVRVLRQRGITLSTRLKIYKAVVLSSLLYGCETWTMYRRHIKQLKHFHNRSLRRIMNMAGQKSPTRRFWTELAQEALSSCYLRFRCAGQVMS